MTRCLFLKIIIVLTFISTAMGSYAVENTREGFLSDWWHQRINVVSSSQIRFSPQPVNDVYLEYEAFGRKGFFDFYGYWDVPKFFSMGNNADHGVWDNGSPLFMEIEPRFSLNELTGKSLVIGPIKEWYWANDYIFDMGRNNNSRGSTLFTGVGVDLNTGLPMSSSINLYGKYQWQNYGAAITNEWDGYRVMFSYFVPVTTILGGQFNYSSFSTYDWGSKLGSESGTSSVNGKAIRTNNAFVSSHIFSLSYTRWHYAAVFRYFYHGGQWNNGAVLNFGNGDFSVDSIGWGYYLVAGFDF